MLGLSSHLIIVIFWVCFVFFTRDTSIVFGYFVFIPRFVYWLFWFGCQCQCKWLSGKTLSKRTYNVLMETLNPLTDSLTKFPCISFCLPISNVVSRQHLCSASRRLLVVPRHRLCTYGRRTFAVTGPTVWNSSVQSPASRCYYRQLQSLVENVFVFSIPVQLAHQMCYDDTLYKFTF